MKQYSPETKQHYTEYEDGDRAWYPARDCAVPHTPLVVTFTHQPPVLVQVQSAGKVDQNAALHVHSDGGLSGAHGAYRSADASLGAKQGRCVARARA